MADVKSPFMTMTREKWEKGCKDYMSRPHKGTN